MTGTSIGEFTSELEDLLAETGTWIRSSDHQRSEFNAEEQAFNTQKLYSPSATQVSPLNNELIGGIGVDCMQS